MSALHRAANALLLLSFRTAVTAFPEEKCHAQEHLDLDGLLLRQLVGHVEASAAACCAACAAATTAAAVSGELPCTVWVWCPANSTGCAAAHASALVFPAGTCGLKHFAPSLRRRAAPATLAHGRKVAWTSGYMPVALPGNTCPFAAEVLPLNADALTTQMRVLAPALRAGSGVIYTLVNKDSARFSLPPFLASLRALEPKLNATVLVACLDTVSCAACWAQHDSCVLMDLGFGDGTVIARNPADKAAIRGYWRVCNTRDFVTRALLALNISVLSVDADVVFLANPFIDDDLGSAPAVVRDVAPFAFDQEPSQAPNGERLAYLRGRWQINGGFAYYPASGGGLALVERLYRYLCTWPRDREGRVRLGIQAVMTRVFQERYDVAPVTADLDVLRPVVLPDDRYLNLCHLDCGVAEANVAARSARSLADLQALDAMYLGTPTYAPCAPEARRRWVFVHTTCQEVLAGEDVSAAKAALQKAFHAWAQGTKAANDQGARLSP